MSSDQAEIIRWANTVGGYFTKKEAVEALGAKYYSHPEKYIGDRLSRMVDVGLLERTKIGHFKVSAKKPAKKAAADVNQTDLFQ